MADIFGDLQGVVFMNERIRELAEQAGFNDRGSNHTAYMNFDHEKFAQLIVRECADVAIDNGCGDFVDMNQLLLKHFGYD